VSPAAPDVGALYKQHGHVVLRRARRILGHEQEAQEALHEIFLGLCASPGEFHGKSAVTTWLYTVTTHHCLNRLRDRRRREELLLQHGPRDATSAARGEAHALVRDVLARMPEELARVAVYHWLDEMTHAEIAEVLGCSRRHVGDLLERALAWARKEAA
jgi:RNA polymerase sigma factor (sigma-70 family)